MEGRKGCGDTWMVVNPVSRAPLSNPCKIPERNTKQNCQHFVSLCSATLDRGEAIQRGKGVGDGLGGKGHLPVRRDSDARTAAHPAATAI